MTRLEVMLKRKKRLSAWGSARKGNEAVFMINNVLCDVKVKRFGSSRHCIVTGSGGIRSG